MSSGAKGLAGRYAGALYALASDAGKIDAVVADLVGFAKLVSENEELKMVVDSPAISWTEQTKVLTEVLEKGGAEPAAAGETTATVVKVSFVHLGIRYIWEDDVAELTKLGLASKWDGLTLLVV